MMDLSIIKILICLCLGIYKGVKAFTTVSNSMFTVKAFFSKEVITDYTINISNSTWLEAEGTCLSWNQTLVGHGLKDSYLYLRILAHRLTAWPTNTHVWLNRVRKVNSTLWLNDLQCGTNGSLPWPVHGNNISSTQCLALNMTSPTNLEYVLFAAPCEKKMGFVCDSLQGFYFDSLGYDLFYATHVIDPINHTWMYQDIPHEACLGHLFQNFTCYAGEYDEEIRACTLYCAPLMLPPETIKLDTASSNVTTAVKSSSRLTISNSTNFVMGSFPLCETTTTNIITTLGVTSTSQSYTDASTEIPGETVVTDNGVTTATFSTHVETTSELNQFSTEGSSSMTTGSSSFHSETFSASTSDGLEDVSSVSTLEYSTSSADTTTSTLELGTTSADTTTSTLGYPTTSTDTTTSILDNSTTPADTTTSTLGYPTTSTDTTTSTLELSTTKIVSTTPKEMFTTDKSTTLSMTSTNTIEHSTTMPSLTDIRTSTATTEGPRSSASPEYVTILYTSTSKTCNPCVCNNDTTTNKTQEQIQEEIAQIKKNLTLEKSTLSSYTRQKNSAPDKRWSSAALGSVGIVIIVAAGSVVVLSDTQHFIWAIKVWKKRLTKYRFSRNLKP
ncbi:serine-rich adhesin for platelets-like [Saccostrea echinata]|uniref:serine-rich adhesin for platelets-like n=1 Tax=Saccostrea echinata TaxID=191078 RepID=UPI002A82C46A|nr:serine-rich adhesin for platelets-like [Saccostrea echinata]